ncbi:unnamed protein product [Prorocentrum cordatum]|uniref:60S ribosomal protein L36 n=1 Tax=Prorocentrum cordatum TaxID=2364126 RepID=A0ABN9XRC4_9DINO|nr:unnamed protein product [Polarella glacialis]
MVLPQGGGAVEVKARRRLKEEGAFEALVNEMETKLAELGNGIPGCTPSVSDLDLSQNHVTPEQLERVLSIVTTHNVFVRRFRLFGIPTFTDDAMRILGDHLRGLTKEQAPTEMHLSDCAITSEGFYHLMSAIEESDLYPGAPPGGKPRPLYLRLENNYISEESLKEKQEAGVVRAFKKSMGQREVTTSSPVKVDIIVHENSSWKQKTGEPPAPENAPPPRMVNDRWDEQQRAKQAMPLAAAAAAAAWGQWQKPQWGGWGGWGGGADRMFTRVGEGPSLMAKAGYVKPEPTGLAAGLNKGFITTRRTLKTKPSYRIGRKSQRGALIKEVVREVAGFAPYERRMIELLRVGSAATLKRALKVAKKRLGTHKRGKKKRDEMAEALAALRKKGARSIAPGVKLDTLRYSVFVSRLLVVAAGRKNIHFRTAPRHAAAWMDCSKISWESRIGD